MRAPVAAVDMAEEESFPVCAGAESSADTAAYRLVWCHERCHKSENEEVRSGLSEALARKSDGAGGLVCFKKANRFAMWIVRTPRPSYTLVTNWREAQPCANAIMQHAGTNRPASMIIICDSARQAHRATSWAKGQPREALGEVLVFDSANIPHHVMGGILREYFSERPSGEVETQVVPPQPEAVAAAAPPGLRQVTKTEEADLGSACSTSIGGDEDSDSLPGSDHWDPAWKQLGAQMAGPAYVPQSDYMQAFGPYGNSVHVAAPPDLYAPRSVNVDIATLARYLSTSKAFYPPPGLTVSL
jgi:hypothetical protein